VNKCIKPKQDIVLCLIAHGLMSFYYSAAVCSQNIYPPVSVGSFDMFLFDDHSAFCKLKQVLSLTF